MNRTRKSGWRAAAIAAALWLAAPAAHAGWFDWLPGGGLDRAIRRVYPALVRIFVVMEDAEDGRMNKGAGSGSGAIISKDGYIVTNHHVAGKATRIVCRLSTGEEIEATLVGSDPLGDIAVLKLKLDTRTGKGALPCARFGNSDRVRVGDTVYAMGSPAGVTQSVTKGIMSNTAMIMPIMMGAGPKLDGEDTGSLVRWFAHDATIFHGNSGGPLVNTSGEIIGINEIGLANLSGAIPGNLAKSVAQQLIATGTVDRSWTGIEAQPRPKSLDGRKGVLVAGVIAGSPAEAAGLRAGDLITRFAGADVDGALPEDIPVFNALALSTPVGATVPLTYRRDAETRTATLTTVARGSAVGRDVELRGWGATGRDYTMLSALENQRADGSGVQLTGIRTGGPSAQAEPGLQAGDTLIEVGGKPVKTVADLTAITQDLVGEEHKRVPTLVTFERGVSRYVTVVRVGRDPRPDDPEAARRPGFPVVLQPVNEELAKALKLPKTEGLRIAYVFPGKSADRAGFRTGDVLLKIDGERIQGQRPEDMHQFQTLIRQYRIGAEAEFAVWRDGQTQTLKLTLEEDDKTATELKSYKDDNFELSVRELTETDRIFKRIPADVRGVSIERVEPAGWASLARVAPGDILMAVNNTPTPDVDSVERELTKAEKDRARRVVLFVRRGIHTLFLEMEPNWDGVAAGPTPASSAALSTPAKGD